MIEIDHLCFSYGVHAVLQDVNCMIKPDCMTFLLGQNGAGKSTLFRCILGQLSPQKGKILLGNQLISQYTIKELARYAAYVPQASNPVFSYPVEQVVLMGRSAYTSLFSAPSKADENIAQEALERMGIAHLAKKEFAHLSGGERQLVLIARALAQQGQVLLMDEPTASLDYGNQLKVLTQIKKLCQEGMSVLISSHNPQHALWFADEVIALDAGKVLAAGTPAEVMTPELIFRLYQVAVRFCTNNGSCFMMPERNGLEGRHVSVE